jgi:hypothetical protein
VNKCCIHVKLVNYVEKQGNDIKSNELAMNAAGEAKPMCN